MYDYLRTGSTTYEYERVAATVKHPEVVKGIIDFLQDGPFKPYLKVKSVRGGRIVLTPLNLNAQVDRVEISELKGDKAQFMIFMKNGDSGWAWDEYRKPPKFNNDAGYNILHLDRMANPTENAEKFSQQMLSFCKGTLVPIIQKAGWVFDPATKRVVPLATWEASEKVKAEAEAAAKAKAEAEAKARAEAEKARVVEESTQAWSVVEMDDGYASEVDVYSSKDKAEAEARNRGNCYVVKGTQMWNEPLGQVEEHDRVAPSRFFR